MIFTIHAAKNGQSVATVRIIPAVAVDKARVLEELGWQVHVTDSTSRQFIPSEFNQLLLLARETHCSVHYLFFCVSRQRMRKPLANRGGFCLSRSRINPQRGHQA